MFPKLKLLLNFPNPRWLLSLCSQINTIMLLSCWCFISHSSNPTYRFTNNNFWICVERQSGYDLINNMTFIGRTISSLFKSRGKDSMISFLELTKLTFDFASFLSLLSYKIINCLVKIIFKVEGQQPSSSSSSSSSLSIKTDDALRNPDPCGDSWVSW